MKKVASKKTIPKLISYTLSASINTAQYENIQPTITVEAQSIEEAHDFLFPYFDSLFKKYSLHNKQVVVTTIQEEVKVPKMLKEKFGKEIETFSNPAKTALNAIMATNDKNALAQLKKKVEESVKISDPEKIVLLKIINQ